MADLDIGGLWNFYPANLGIAHVSDWAKIIRAGAKNRRQAFE
jgi:hypothetical protein